MASSWSCGLLRQRGGAERGGVERLDGQDQAVEVAHGQIALPLAGKAVAQEQVVAMLAQKAAALAEAVADLVDVLGQAGQEQPAGAGGEGLGMALPSAPACRFPDRR